MTGRDVAGVDAVGEHVQRAGRQLHRHDVEVGRPLTGVPQPEDDPLAAGQHEGPLGADLVALLRRHHLVDRLDRPPPLGRMRPSPESISK